MSDDNQSMGKFLLSKEGRPILIGAIAIFTITGLVLVYVYNALFSTSEPVQRDPFAGAQIASSQVSTDNLPSNRADLTSDAVTPEAEAMARKFNEQASADPNMHPIPTKSDVLYIPEGLPKEGASSTQPQLSQSPNGLPQQQMSNQQFMQQQQLNEKLERERQAYQQQRVKYFTSVLMESSTPSRIAAIQLEKAASGASKSGAESSMHVGTKDGKPVVIDKASDNKKMLVRGSDILFAVSDLALSSDFKGPVRVTFLQGELDGWTGLGTFEANEQGLKLQPKLTTLIDPAGKTYQVDAYILDPQTTLWAIASNVDRHLIYRYGGWGLHKVFSTFGKVAQQSAVAASSVNANGSAQTTYREIDDKQLLYTFGGEIGDLLADIFKDNLSRKATIETFPNEQLGVLFMSTLYE